MKRHLIAVIAALCVLSAADVSAQRNRPGRHHAFNNESGISLSAGYVHSGYKNKLWTEDEIRRDKGLNGFYLGMAKDFPIVRRTLYFQTGLTYNYLNSTERYTENTLKLDMVSDRNEHYLDIPFRLKFIMNVLPEMRAFIYAGPTLDFGLSATKQYRTKLGDNNVGKYKYNYNTGKMKESSIPGFAPELPESPYRRFDVFMGGAIGVELYDIAEVKLGFDWGLINKNKNKNVADYVITHRNMFNLGLSLRF